MIERIKEIRECLNTNHYEAALALALTLPDICGQVEYGPNVGVGDRYRNWISNFVDKEILCDSVFENDFEHLTSADLYKLRCSFLHSGNDDLKTKHIDEFHLLSPYRTNGQYGYRYGTKTNADGTETHIAEIDIKYLCEMLCDVAEKYYKSRKPEDFEEHTFVLQT